MRFDLPYSEGSSWERRFIWWHAWLSHPSHANDAADQSNNVGNFHPEILKHEWKIWNSALFLSENSKIYLTSESATHFSTFFPRKILQHFHAESGIHFPLQTSDILTFCILKNTEPIREHFFLSPKSENHNLFAMKEKQGARNWTPATQVPWE